MKSLTDYIMVIDDAIDADICDSLIKKFDSANDLIKRDDSWGFDYRSFHELNLTTHSDFKEEQTLFYERSEYFYELYKMKCNIQFMPQRVGFEDVRMKRYDPNGKDQIGWHTDVGDYASARRFLVMFYYLNDVEDGGETVFSDLFKSGTEVIKVRPKKGRIVMFPPMWMYPHKGNQPIKKSKYIISTYLHYT